MEKRWGTITKKISPIPCPLLMLSMTAGQQSIDPGLQTVDKDAVVPIAPSLHLPMGGKHCPYKHNRGQH